MIHVGDNVKKIQTLNFIHTDTERQKNILSFPDTAFNTFHMVTKFDQWLARKLLVEIGNPPVSIKLWNNEEIICSTLNPVTRIKIKDRSSVFMLLVNPGLHFGDLYSTGKIDIEGDIPLFLDIIYRYLHKRNKHSLLSFWIKNRPRSNSLTDSRKNIHHHYDISNEFYQQWLDHENMQYTCAYFPDPSMSLEQAQIAKMHHICRKLSLKPGQKVVEAGCGWGGLARFMAKEYGAIVKAYNISHQQITYAHQKMLQENLAEQVEFIEDDYRNIQGNYDVFVSVGMLEHIGIDNYHKLGEVINSILKEDGMGLIHAIGRNQPGQLNEWIEARIFPGACPPSLGQMMNIFEPWSFSILDVENLRLHYAKTLEHWLTRFEKNINTFRYFYDEAFVRAWRLYLTGSMAAFTSGTMQLFQILFTRQQNNKLHRSRSYLYDNQPN